MEPLKESLTEAEARFQRGDYAGAGVIFHRAWDAGHQQAGVRYASCLRLAGFARPALQLCRQLAQQAPADLASSGGVTTPPGVHGAYRGPASPALLIVGSAIGVPTRRRLHTG